MGYLLDTNVLSELRKKRRCNPAVAAWVAEAKQEDRTYAVTVQID